MIRQPGGIATALQRPPPRRKWLTIILLVPLITTLALPVLLWRNHHRWHARYTEPDDHLVRFKAALRKQQVAGYELWCASWKVYFSNAHMASMSVQGTGLTSRHCHAQHNSCCVVVDQHSFVALQQHKHHIIL